MKTINLFEICIINQNGKETQTGIFFDNLPATLLFITKRTKKHRGIINYSYKQIQKKYYSTIEEFEKETLKPCANKEL